MHDDAQHYIATFYVNENVRSTSVTNCTEVQDIFTGVTKAVVLCKIFNDESSF